MTTREITELDGSQPTAEQTTEASTDAVRLLATFCDAHGRPLLASELYQPLVTEGLEAIAHYSPAELSVVSDYLRRGRRLHQRHLTRVRAMPPPNGPTRHDPEPRSTHDVDADPRDQPAGPYTARAAIRAPMPAAGAQVADAGGTWRQPPPQRPSSGFRLHMNQRSGMASSSRGDRRGLVHLVAAERVVGVVGAAVARL